MDIFQYNRQEHKKNSPLADRMRPQTLDEFVGQEHILAPGRLLRRAIQADRLSSLLFYGPPGTGKTTLARIIANTTQADFLAINAVLAGVKDIRESIAKAEKSLEEQARKTILFVDEVHRFNKAQQDALLPHVENGTLILVGATTENPYFEVNKALVSRSRIFQLRSLTEDAMKRVAEMALAHKERGYGKEEVQITDDALNHLVQVASGDARALLNALELAVTTSEPDADGSIRIDLSVAEESIQQRAVLYDKDGDAHFDTISAFIKSVRGSDVDAALYWLAKMVYAGEDPRFLFRRMIILASEDVGMADPNALSVVNSAAQAFDYVGMPEGRFHLAQACIYLASAPKSNSAFAFFDALNHVQNESKDEVPNHLKDGSRDKKGFGHGEGYLYPHAYKDHWIAQQYLPDGLQGKVFYHPSHQGFESGVSEEVERRREIQLAGFFDNQSSATEEDWRERTLSDSGSTLEFLRDQFFEYLDIPEDPLVLNLNGGNGLLAGELVRKARNLHLHVAYVNEQERDFLKHQYAKASDHAAVFPIAESAIGRLEKEGVLFDLIIGKNAFFDQEDKSAYLKDISRMMKSGGVLSALEPVPSQSQRISDLISEVAPGFSFLDQLKQSENELYSNPENSKTNWTPEMFEGWLKDAGFQKKMIKSVKTSTGLFLSPDRIEKWFQPSLSGELSYHQLLTECLKPEDFNQLIKETTNLLQGRKIQWDSHWMLFRYSKPA